MANIKANIKSIKKDKERNLKNRQIKSQVKTSLNKAKKAILSGTDEVKDLVAKAHKEITTAVSKGVIHKNNGSRKMARLDALLKKHQVNAKINSNADESNS